MANVESSSIHTELPSILLENLNQQRIAGKECEFHLGNDQQTARVHRCLIRAFSPAVDNACNRNPRCDQFSLPDVPEPVLEALVIYFYTATLVLNCNTILAMYQSAVLLQIPHLVDSCMTYLQRTISLENYSRYMEFARKYGYEDLTQLCLEFCVNNFEKLIKDEEYLKIQPEDFLQIIFNESLFAQDEEAIFDSLHRWIEYDPKNRHEYAEKLSSAIRYQLIGVHRLIKILQCPGFQYSHDHIRTALVDIGALAEPLARLRWERRTGSLSSVTRSNEDRTSESNVETNPSTPVLPCGFEKKRKILAVLGGRSNNKKTLKDVLCFKLEISPDEENQSHENDQDTNTKLAEDNRLIIQSMNSYPLTQMPSPRRGFGVALACNQLFVIGGKPTTSMQTVHVYDVTLGEWLSGPPLLQGRSWLGVTQNDRGIYAIGGVSRSGQILDTVEHLDMRTGVWVSVPPMPRPRMSVAASSVDQGVYAIGGFNEMTCDFFDIVAGKWINMAPLETVHEACGAVTYENHLYVFGGTGEAGSMSCVERYLPSENRWELLNPMPSPRAFAAVAQVDNYITVVGGRNDSEACRDVHVYQVHRDRWSSVPDMMPSARSGCCAICLDFTEGT